MLTAGFPTEPGHARMAANGCYSTVDELAIRDIYWIDHLLRRQRATLQRR